MEPLPLRLDIHVIDGEDKARCPIALCCLDFLGEFVVESFKAAESAVTQATSQLELMRALVDQARVVDDEASRARTTAHETLTAACRTYVAAIDNIDVATADNRSASQNSTPPIWIRWQLPKGSWHSARKRYYESATRTHADTVHALTVRTNYKWEHTE